MSAIVRVSVAELRAGEVSQTIISQPFLDEKDGTLVMMNDPALALHRFGLGAKPGQSHDLPGDLRSVLKAALDGEDRSIESISLRSTQAGLTALAEFQAKRRQRNADGASGKDVGGSDLPHRSQGPPASIS